MPDENLGITEEDLNAATVRGVADAAAAGHVAPEELPRLADFLGQPAPTAAIWRDAPNFADGATLARGRDVIASVGEPAVLAAPGKSGKSYLALDLALAAAVAAETGAPYGAACGLRARAGDTVIRSYEDRAVRMAARLKTLIRRLEVGGAAAHAEVLHAAARRIRIAVDPEPLCTPGDSRAYSVATSEDVWPAFWGGVKAAGPALVILDPLSALAGGANLNDGGTARYVMGKIAAESERTGAGVLIIAHDTKGARNEAKAGGDPGAGAVSGSGTWFDAARGVVYLYRNPEHADQRMLVCLASNHGRDGWGAALDKAMPAPGDDFAGYVMTGKSLEPDAVDAAKAEWRGFRATGVHLPDTGGADNADPTDVI